MGRAQEELGIEAIVARSLQAKGRIKRTWRTFQDRLISELRLSIAIWITMCPARRNKVNTRYTSSWPDHQSAELR